MKIELNEKTLLGILTIWFIISMTIVGINSIGKAGIDKTDVLILLSPILIVIISIIYIKIANCVGDVWVETSRWI